MFCEVALKLYRGSVVALLLLMPSWSCLAAESGDIPAPETPPPQAPQQLAHWYDLSRLPFIPVPSVGADPNSGTTVGLLPVWLHTDEKHNVTRIIAPDITHNPYFGWGFHGRIFSYASEDEQWSIVGGARERVERGVDAEYQIGRLREGAFTLKTNVAYDRDGTPRFFGIGNNSPFADQTNYTNQTSLVQEQIGWNFSHTWQWRYTIRKRVVQVFPGTLSSIPSIQTRFPNLLGLGTNSELLNRYSLIYDTRNDLTAPRSGMRVILYAGLASRGGIFNDSLYSEAGGDWRAYWPVRQNTILAAHASLRYLPSAHRLPFWALSSLGGDQSEIGPQQLLRGYGAGRFYDRNEFSGTVEVRRIFWSFDAVSTHIDMEVAPFVDVGQVFARTSTFPIQRLHKVGGVGFRGLALPSVVGYVDVGYGSEGAAVFTGINYPF